MLAPWKKSNDKPRQCVKKHRHYFANKGPSSQRYNFSSSHVWVWEPDNKKVWVPKIWYLQTVMLEKTFESPLERKIKPMLKEIRSMLKEINPKYSLEGLVMKLILQYFGHLMWKTDSLEKIRCWERLRAGKGDDRGWDGWMASLTQWTWVWASLGVSDGQGTLACCSPWGHKELEMTEWLNRTE